jgi:spermidine synthase
MNDLIKIEVITTADSEQIKSLYKEAGWWDENDGANLVQKIVQGSFCFVVAAIDKRLIGMGRAISDGACDAYIQDVVVSSAFRGKGIGARIVGELITYLKSKNINWITLISEPDAVPFYQKYGFSQMLEYVPFMFKK